jgi:hypothetical protein
LVPICTAVSNPPTWSSSCPTPSTPPAPTSTPRPRPPHRTRPRSWRHRRGDHGGPQALRGVLGVDACELGAPSWSRSWPTRTLHRARSAQRTRGPRRDPRGLAAPCVATDLPGSCGATPAQARRHSSGLARSSAWPAPLGPTAVVPSAGSAAVASPIRFPVASLLVEVPERWRPLNGQRRAGPATRPGG